MAFCVGLLSASITFSRFIHIVAGVSMSFLIWLNNIPLYGYTMFCSSVYLLILFREKLNQFSVSPVATIVPGAAQGWLETPHIDGCADGTVVKGMWLRGHSGLSWLTRVCISWHELCLPQRVSPSVFHRQRHLLVKKELWEKEIRNGGRGNIMHY